jgi:Domain of unknown function (DUF4389)
MVPLGKGVVKVTDLPLAAPAPATGVSRRADEILMAFAGPARQRRLTVLLRWILAIPHLVVLYALGIAAEVVVIVAWFAALFTGQVPGGLADFLTGYLRWNARVYGYLFLLTDEYPPFTLADQAYPVRAAFGPVPLNRLAVLFRLFLVIPAGVIAGVLGFGVAIAMLVIWLIVLVTGQMPAAVHQAVAAVARYTFRYYGYVFLLTATYPEGLFGDPVAGLASPEPSPVAAGAGPGLTTEDGGAAGEGAAGPGESAGIPAEGEAAPAEDETRDTGPAAGVTPAAAESSPATPTAAGWEPATGEPALGPMLAPPGAGPQAWQLVLSSGARRLVAVFLVLGILGLIGYGAAMGALVAGAAGTANRAGALNQVQVAHSALGTTMNGLQAKVAACQSNLPCVATQEGQAGRAFSTFQSAVRSTAMPGSATTASSQLQRDTGKIAQAFHQLSTATSPAQYQQILLRTGLQQLLSSFDADYQQLLAALGG